MEAAQLRRAARQAASGSEEAAGSLFDRYHPRLFRYALAKLGNRQDAEDVASETFARVLRDLEKFRWKGAGFEAWIFRIASNLVVDRVRKTAREITGHAALDETRAARDGDPQTQLLAGELTRELTDLLNLLAHDQREVLQLRFAGGLDTAEVARVMDRKTNAVRQLQFRALERMRELMREEVSAR